MTTLYRPVLIESAELPMEKFPEGTIATHPDHWPVERCSCSRWESNGPDRYDPDMVGWTALVPIEAEEVWGSQDKSGGISRAHAGAEDPLATVKLHIAERAALGHPDRLVSHYVTPWEEA